MKRAEFVKCFCEARKRAYRIAMDKGELKVSEAVMGMAEAESAALKSWRKHRATLRGMTPAELGWQ